MSESNNLELFPVEASVPVPGVLLELDNQIVKVCLSKWIMGKFTYEQALSAAVYMLHQQNTGLLEVIKKNEYKYPEPELVKEEE